jgi:hypothetical protein
MICAKVRCGSNSEVESHSRRVRSTSNNGHRQTGPTGPTGPFRAKNRLMHRSKTALLFDHFVGAEQERLRDR